jgi:AcrR family transcriptional regulator
LDEDKGDGENLFRPKRLYNAGGADDRRARHERARERQIAAWVSKRREQGGRSGGPRTRGLSQAGIVDVAVAIADAEGPGAVSMRRIAKELQVGPMSLYWYIDSKEELHQLMLETVQAEFEAPEPSADWRADLTGYARNTRAAVLRHPWAIDFLGAGPPSGPNDARNIDRLIGTLSGRGLDAATTMWALLALGTYVIGAALREIQEIRWHAAFDDTTTETEADELYDEFQRRIRESGQYPNLEKIMDEDLDPDAPETRDDRFEFGLSCLLDGIAARIGKD